MARVLLYDEDCGFCTQSARWALRAGCDVELISWQRWEHLAQHGITPEAAGQALHLVDDGRVLIGHEAVAGTLLSSRHVALRLAGRIVGARLLRPLASRVYALVAANRHRLPGATDACRLT